LLENSSTLKISGKFMVLGGENPPVTGMEKTLSPYYICELVCPEWRSIVAFYYAHNVAANILQISGR
jgi:hypothetical protein